MGDLTKRFPVYSKFLRLYPRAYQKDYSDQMLQTLADMLDDAETRGEQYAIWLRTALDLPLSAGRQQIVTVGGIMTHETPNYVKRNAVIGAAFILPFFTIIIINSLSNHALANSNGKRSLFIFLLVVLPALAFLINFASYIKWLSDQKVAFLKKLLDLKHSWPAVAAAGLGLMIALFVPFHDSVHCVTGNPIKEIHNPHQTLTCIINS